MTGNYSVSHFSLTTPFSPHYKAGPSIVCPPQTPSTPEQCKWFSESTTPALFSFFFEFASASRVKPQQQTHKRKNGNLSIYMLFVSLFVYPLLPLTNSSLPAFKFTRKVGIRFLDFLLDTLNYFKMVCVYLYNSPVMFVLYINGTASLIPKSRLICASVAWPLFILIFVLNFLSIIKMHS